LYENGHFAFLGATYTVL